MMLNNLCPIRAFRIVRICRRNCNSSTAPKPYSDIPGPRGIFGIGTFYKYAFGNGGKGEFWGVSLIFDPILAWDRIHETGMEKYKKYGPIVRERLMPGVELIWIFDPDDIGTVLSDFGTDNLPRRKSHLALEKYRKDRPQAYRTAGLLSTNGQEWWEIRSELQKGLSSPAKVRNYLPLVDDTVKDFVDGIRETRPNKPVLDFLPEISRLNLELVCLLAFDARMNAFSSDERKPFSKTSRLIEAAEITNQNILATDQGFPLWRWIETPTYRRIRKAQEFMESVAVDLVTQKLTYFEEHSPAERPQSLLDEYLRNPRLELRDIVGMASDLLLAGVHTTAFSTAFALYHIARHPAVQDRLFAEAKRLLPSYSDDGIEPAALNSEASFTRAVLKESLRLNPISVGVARLLNHDTVLSGYVVPKESIVITQGQVACRLERNFFAPDEFRPERWLRDENGKAPEINPYLSLPFGHGMRACIARRFAEQNMLVLLIRLIRKFHIGWAGAHEVGVVTKLINQPDQPIKLTFQRRSRSK